MRRRVWPSGAAFAAASVPMMPPAPPWLSATTCLPRRSASWKAIMRPTTSLLPPGGNGMMSRTGLLGYGWAEAFAYSAAAKSASNPRVADRHLCILGIVDSSLAHAQLDQRRGLDVLAEPRLERRLALADIFDASVLLRHRQVVAWNENTARPSLPPLPDPLDRRAAHLRVVASFALSREQLGAVLRRVAGEDDVAFPAPEDEHEVARRVARRDVCCEPRHELFSVRGR